MPKISDEGILKIIDAAMDNFQGNSETLGSAIGALHIGRHMGWKTVYLLHTRATIKKYQEILGVDFREILDEETINSNRSVAFIAVQKVSNFWKAVKGEIQGVRSQEFKKPRHR